jgi:hypothetical protein
MMPMEKYAEIRRTAFYPLKRDIRKLRRVDVGPFGSATFENYDLNWIQVHEMLFIEKGGEAQLDDELLAYNALVPKGNDLGMIAVNPVH